MDRVQSRRLNLALLFIVGVSATAQSTLTPSTLSFGNQATNESSAPKTVTFKNTQAAP